MGLRPRCQPRQLIRSTAPKDVEVAFVATVTIAVLLVRLADHQRGEAHRDLTLLDSSSRTFRILEVDDGEATIAILAHLVHGHVATIHRTKLVDDLGQEFILGDVLRDLGQADTLRVRDLLLLLLILLSLLGLESLGVEDTLFGHSDGSLLTSLVFFSLVLLESVHAGLELADLEALNVVLALFSLSVAHPGAKIFFLGLHLVVGMPHVVSVQHCDVSVASDGIITLTNTKRVENWVSLAAFGVAFGDWDLRLEDAAVEMLDDGASISELNLLHVVSQVENLGKFGVSSLELVHPGSESTKLLSSGYCCFNHDHYMSSMILKFDY